MSGTWHAGASRDSAAVDGILAFWFGEGGTPERGKPRDAWFVKDEAFDRTIVERFGALIESALAGSCDDWVAAPRSALAYVVLLDQFTRNAHRGTAQMFAGDARALACARRIVARGWDLGWPPVHRWFCYLPFEHSEALRDQDRAVELFESLRADPASASAIDYAHRHGEVIRRFGRFPHRNEILGRASTPQEIEFLKRPDSRF